MGYFAGFIVWLLLGFATGSIAVRKGRSGIWYLWGFLFGVIAFLIAICLSDVSKTNSASSAHASGCKCPSCGAANSSDSLFCTHCGKEIEQKKSGSWQCDSCGTSNEPSARFCKSCGKPNPTKPAAPAPSADAGESEPHNGIIPFSDSMRDSGTVVYLGERYDFSLANESNLSGKDVVYVFDHQKLTIRFNNEEDAKEFYKTYRVAGF